MRTIIAGTLVLLALAAAPASAHEGLHARLARTTERIDATPDGGDLYLRRAELHRLHEDWDAALADVERAAQRGAGADALSRSRAILLLDTGCPQAALVVLDALVARRPEHAEAHSLRGEALKRMDRPLAAAAAYEQAVASAPVRRPEHYLSCARAFADAGVVEEAIAALDRGLADLGNLVTLQRCAIEFERRAGRLDAALARVDRVLDGARRKENWLALRADVLEESGCHAAADAARREALAAIGRLPRTRRSTGAMLALQSSIQQRLQAVQDVGHLVPPLRRTK